MTLAQALAHAASLGLQRLDAQLLLLQALGRRGDERAWLIAHDADPLPAPQAAAFEAMCRRRLAGEPVAYLVGHKEFFGLDLQVDARVLVPRPDTETLVEWALEVLQSQLPAHPHPAVADLGTGSGAIALALKRHCPHAQLLAIDQSAQALDVARANGQRLGLTVDWRQGHWLDGAPRGLALIATNPPYIAQDDPHLAALTHEPRSALAAGADGLDDIRQIVAQARSHLAPGGWLMIEHGWDQAAPVRALLAAAGFTQVKSRTDLAGIERCSGGQWPG